MYGIYPYLPETQNIRTSIKDQLHLPKWAMDEKLYNCEPPYDTKNRKDTDKTMPFRAIL